MCLSAVLNDCLPYSQVSYTGCIQYLGLQANRWEVGSADLFLSLLYICFSHWEVHRKHKVLHHLQLFVENHSCAAVPMHPVPFRAIEIDPDGAKAPARYHWRKVLSPSLPPLCLLPSLHLSLSLYFCLFLPPLLPPFFPPPLLRNACPLSLSLSHPWWLLLVLTDWKKSECFTLFKKCFR